MRRRTSSRTSTHPRTRWITPRSSRTCGSTAAVRTDEDGERTKAGPPVEGGARRGSAVEQDLDHVPVPDAIGPALGPDLAVLLRLGDGPQREQVLVPDRLRPDEALREVRVDRARGID